jgi:hypothetical protein
MFLSNEVNFEAQQDFNFNDQLLDGPTLVKYLWFIIFCLSPSFDGPTLVK